MGLCGQMFRSRGERSEACKRMVEEIKMVCVCVCNGGMEKKTKHEEEKQKD